MTDKEKAYFSVHGMSNPPAIRVWNLRDKKDHWHFGADCAKVEVPGYGYIWIRQSAFRAEALPDQCTVKYYKAGELVPAWHEAECKDGDPHGVFGRCLKAMGEALIADKMTNEEYYDLVNALSGVVLDACQARRSTVPNPWISKTA